MKTISKLSSLLFILGLFSCSPVYLPNSRNVPMFSKAGEVQGSLSFGAGYNVQAAVAITNNIGIMANGMYADSKDLDKKINKYTFGEVGLGYFKNNNDKFYFDVFGGYGTGKTSSTDTAAFAFHSINPSGYNYNVGSATYHRYFIQPSIGLKRKHFHGAIAYRFSMIDFKTGTHNGTNVNINRDPVVFFEPAVVLKFPFEQFVLSVNAGLSSPMNKADRYFDYVPMVISTGVGFRIGYKAKEQN